MILQRETEGIFREGSQRDHRVEREREGERERDPFPLNLWHRVYTPLAII